MSADIHSPFELLEPPSGGADKLRARLAAGEPGPFVAEWVSAFSLVALAVLVASLYLGSSPPEPSPAVAAHAPMLDAPEFDRLLGREPEIQLIRVELDQEPIQAEEVESTDPRVRIYQLL